MTASQRIRICRLIEKMNKQQNYCSKLGIENNSIYRGKVIRKHSTVRVSNIWYVQIFLYIFHALPTDGIPIEGYRANISDVADKVLGVVINKYQVVQNKILSHAVQVLVPLPCPAGIRPIESKETHIIWASSKCEFFRFCMAQSLRECSLGESNPQLVLRRTLIWVYSSVGRWCKSAWNACGFAGWYNSEFFIYFSFLCDLGCFGMVVLAGY